MNFTKVGIGIVRNDEGKILLAQRTQPEELADGSRLTWVFPGGKLEAGEATDMTATREVHEETGYRVEALELITNGMHAQNPDKFVSYWACQLTDQTPDAVTDPSIAQSKWVDVHEIPEHVTSPLNETVASYLGMIAAK